jgi:4-alpha-glucanotransferase
MLPLSPPDEHGSPYASYSAFAVWDRFRDPAMNYSLDYESVEKWIEKNRHWLEDYALFAVLKYQLDGLPWTQWPAPLRDRNPEAIKEVIDELYGSMNKWMEEQFIIEIDWGKLRNTAEECGVSLFGDLPFFVAHDSADVWANQHLFKLEASGAPSVVAGVPPDYFSEDGQKWGTVLYNWDAHRDEDFAWWKARTARMFEMFDLVRIDHFRALDSAWEIPAHHPTAKNGQWVQGPKTELLEAILEVAPAGKIVAEDLGIIPPSVIELRKQNGIPGMAVLHFANDDVDNPHNPENHSEDTVVYTGTHDNDTTVGWGGKPVQDLIQDALNSPANLAIIPIQDVMGLGSQARMNTPGTLDGNWEWRFNWDELTNDSLNWFGQQVYRSGRGS